MKIGNSPEKPKPVTGGTAPVNADAAKTGVAPTGPDASAQVALSTTASTLLSGSSNAEFDTAKVARISQAITDGKYSINAGVIADKLISNAQELLGKQQR